MTCISPEELIIKIQHADTLSDVLDVHDLKNEYRAAVKWLHPDRCKLTDAAAALVKLHQLKDALKTSDQLKDDAGPFRSTDLAVYYQGGFNLLQISYDNYVSIKDIGGADARHFHQYLPASMGLTEELKVVFSKRAIPISGLMLPQEHVNWVLSRLLEVCAWLAQHQYVHAGINPESVFIVPETHGIILTSFYHLTIKNRRLKTISSKYQHWYPPEVFSKKRATTLIDLELCKRTAAYLLGDRSGMGIKLKKSHNTIFIDFLLDQHTNAYQCYDDYRKMLRKNFERKFYHLAL